MNSPTIPGHEPGAATHVGGPAGIAATSGAPGRDVVTRRFPATGVSVGRARRFLLEQLGVAAPGGCNESIDLLALMLSELATNAVQHADTEFEVDISVTEQAGRPVGPGQRRATRPRASPPPRTRRRTHRTGAACASSSRSPTPGGSRSGETGPARRCGSTRCWGDRARPTAAEPRSSRGARRTKRRVGVGSAGAERRGAGRRALARARRARRARRAWPTAVVASDEHGRDPLRQRRRRRADGLAARIAARALGPRPRTRLDGRAVAPGLRRRSCARRPTISPGRTCRR